MSFMNTNAAAGLAGVRWVAALGLLAAIAGPLVTSDASAKGKSDKPVRLGEIHFHVTVDNSRGQVACALFDRKGWLEKSRHAGFVKIEGNQAHCAFKKIPPGIYAISAFHDENSNEELDTNFLGIPTESWVTSRDASAVLGPPSFDAAKFLFKGGMMVMRERM
jgi:uncharacterized protein (DUF2141 family)